MLPADLGLSLEPALPALGMPVLLVIALALAVLTVWTYLGVQKATWRRVCTVVLLRLLALAAALLLLLRPSFAMTQLEGIEVSKLFVLFDASESMSVADVDGRPTRWEQMNKLWEAHAVQRRLEELKSVQKIEVVKYLAAEELRVEDAGAQPTGKRTDIGAWLQQLFTKHGHEKHLRGIVIFSDGADNGTRFSAQEKAGLWRGIAPIHAFGVGDPGNQKFKKDIGLTRIDVTPTPVIVKSKMEVNVIAQAPGYENAKVDVSVWIEEVNEKMPVLLREIKDFEIKQAKDQPIRVGCETPEHAGEYKVTLKIAPQPDEANILNNEISTYIQVIKPKINILWVDRPRVYEPRFAIEALTKEERFKVYYVEPPSDGKGDPLAIYKLDEQAYDVIVIGDISAQRFCQSKPEIFERIKKMVANKTALLMLGGEETFANGDWHKQPAIMDLLPVTFDGPPAFSTRPVRVEPTPGAPRFLQLHAVPKENEKIWKDDFDPLDGIAALGSLAKDSTVLLGVDGDKKKPVLVATQSGLGGRVVVFASDATARCWYDSPEAVQAHHVFWKQLVGWLARQEDNANELWIKLDKRRLSTDAADVLGFTFGLRGKAGDLLGAKFDAKIVGPNHQAFPVRFNREDQHQRGSFQGAKEPGEYKIVIDGSGKDGDKDVKVPGTARFLVADDNVEMLRPAAEHETLIKIAAASDGRFSLASEAELLQWLDELKSQASRDARQKTIHWPDWQRLPPSDHVRDQLAGLWNSFAFVGFLLFVLLIGAEWTLRRMWGLV
jgi:uncharacterized membrane protein